MDIQTARRHMQHLSARPFVTCACCLLFSALLLSVAGCGSKARAAVIPDGPPLAIPAPPPHEIAIEQVAETQPPEPAPAPEPAPEPPRPPAVTRTPARPEPRETPAAAQPTPPPAVDAPTVRGNVSPADERRVTDLITKAAADLKRVDYQRLSTEGREQYNQSKQFSDEARQAIKERNIPYALTLAEKAAQIAAQLVR